MQMQTERGLIFVETKFPNKEEAIKDGYHYMFTSHKLNRDIYGICTDNEGHHYKCALVNRG